MKYKIKQLSMLADHLTALRVMGQRIVLSHGVFDGIHTGHVRHLQEAKSAGDVLVVTVTADKNVQKGPGRPVFTAEQRCETLAALQAIDFVAVSEFPSACEAIRLLKPNLFAKHIECRDDPSRHVEWEEAAVKEHGGRLLLTSGEVFSSSALLNRSLPTVPKAAQEWLAGFRHTAAEVNGYLDAAKALSVGVIGDHITDEYVWCRAIGKSGKEPVLVVEELRRESHEGGSVAVFNHARAFASGSPQAVIHGENRTVKRRYVNEYPMQKLFEIYVPGVPSMSGLSEHWFDRAMMFGVAIVADYGHGLIDETAIQLLPAVAKLLCVNVQSNAGNAGYNTHDRYGRIDYLCLSEAELRLAARQRNGDVRALVEKAAQQHGCKAVTVTRGNDGVLCWGKESGFVECPAFSSHFVDRVGAGDAVLAVTSLLVALDAPTEIVALVANAVGALAVQVIGNRESVQKVALQKFIVRLLKR